MTVVRSKWVAVLAVLLWATVGALAGDHCVCDEVASACEHAGVVCAEENDCSDCFSATPAAFVAEEALALAPQAKSQVLLPSAAGTSAGVRLRSAEVRVRFERVALFVPLRPPALRAGTMCLRV